MPIFTAAVGAFTFISGAIGTFMTTIGPLGAFLLKTAVGIGVNLLLAAIAGKPKDPTFQINGNLQIGGDLPRTFGFGEYMTAGSLAYANTWGKEDETDNAYLTQVIALSDMPVTSLTTLWTNGEETPLFVTDAVTSVGDLNAIGQMVLTEFKNAFGILDDFLFKVGRQGIGDKLEFIFSWLEDRIQFHGGTPLRQTEQSEMGFPIPAYVQKGDNLWIKFFDGNQTAHDLFLLNRVSTPARPWDDDRIGKGVAYAVMTARVTKNMFSGIPAFKFVMRGIPLYDITKDSTVPGGSGTHRWDDQTTWGGDGDFLPAVQAYNVLRGIYHENEWVYGLQGTQASQLPPDNWINAINKCRLPVVADDGFEPQYRSSGEVRVDAPIGNLLDELCTACAGRISEEGGVYRMFVGAPEAPSFHITDGDILSTSSQEFTPFFGLSDSVNGVHANYPSPKDGWEMKSAPPMHRTDLEVIHGNRRLMTDIDLVFVPYPEQVQRLMRSTVLEAQRARRHTFSLPPAYWAYCVPGETFTWTSDRNGYILKLFRIDGVQDLPNLDVIVDVTEVDPADYDWDSATDYIPPVIAPTGPVRPSPQPIIDFFAEPDTVIGSGDKIRPAIRLEWDKDKVDIEGVQWTVRLTDTLEVVSDSSTDAWDVGAIKISNNLFSLTSYQIRARYIPQSDRDTLWSEWYTVITPDIRFNDVLVTLNNQSQDVKDLLGNLRTAQQAMSAKLQQLAAAALEGIRQEVSSRGIAVRLGEDYAASYEEFTASISSINGAITAQAAIVAAVEAVVGDTAAGVLWRMAAQVGSGDVISRADLQVKVDVAGSWMSAGLTLEAGLVGGNPLLPFSRVLLYGQEVVIADHLGNVSALFDSNGIYLNTVFIHDLESVNIKARSIFGDRIVVSGVDTPELQLNSVTYIEEDSSTGNVSVTGTASLLQTCFLDDYVSGGVLGAGNIIFTPSLLADVSYHTVTVYRSSASDFSVSPKLVGRSLYGQYDLIASGPSTAITCPFADVPPSSGDWYYGLFMSASFSTVTTARDLVIAHAKR